jgi:xanthine dehydrogenase accessory factor
MGETTRDLFRVAHERVARGEPVAMTTVVATRGSTPQKAGARMLIFSDGKMHGTIGGGCIEAEVWSEATRLMRRGQSALREFTLADDPDHPGGDVCGGTMEVFIDVLRPAQLRPNAASEAVQDSLAAKPDREPASARA